MVDRLHLELALSRRTSKSYRVLHFMVFVVRMETDWRRPVNYLKTAGAGLLLSGTHLRQKRTPAQLDLDERCKSVATVGLLHKTSSAAYLLISFPTEIQVDIYIIEVFFPLVSANVLNLARSIKVFHDYCRRALSTVKRCMKY